MTSTEPEKQSTSPGHRPFRLALLRGLGIMLPPLLTIVLFLWALNTVDTYVLRPLEGVTRYLIVMSIKDVREFDEFPKPSTQVDVDVDGNPVSLLFDDQHYLPVGEQWLPRDIHGFVVRNPGPVVPATAEAYYDRYVTVKWMQRSKILPVFLGVFVLLLYFLGKFMAAGVGRILLSNLEALITRLPLIRNVYSSVKQVTDFLVAERSVEYNRVVAVEYPRRGIWSIGFVTGEGMLDIRSAANEPVLTVLMPTSPMPATGFTVTIRKSETIDLNITIDQAIQFVVSCGVVVPPQQQQASTAINIEVQRAVAARISGNGSAQPSGEHSGAADAADNDRAVTDGNAATDKDAAADKDATSDGGSPSASSE